MYIVSGQQLKKYHAANLILDGALFDIHTGEKVVLNGSDIAHMAKLWDTREGLQAELDALLGEWAELE